MYADQSAEIVKEKGMTKNPENEEGNKSASKTESEGVGGTSTDSSHEHKEKLSMMDKVKAKIHKS